MENNFANRFASFYAEHADTYADDMDLALEDFQGFESMESEYGFLEGVKNVASTAGSAIKTGAQAVGGVAKKVGSATGSVLKTASKVTGVTSLAQGAKRAAYGAAVGGTVNAVRGKSVAKGMGAGAAVGVVGGGMINKGASEASNLYNKAKERFHSDMSYSDAQAFADFYSEMEDIYQDDMDEAFSDYIQLYTDEDEYSVKQAANNVKDFATKTIVGKAVTGAVAGNILAQGITSVGAEADMRRQLKKKLYDGTISKNERVQLERLIDKRNKTKKWTARAGGLVGAIA